MEDEEDGTRNDLYDFYLCERKLLAAHQPFILMLPTLSQFVLLTYVMDSKVLEDRKKTKAVRETVRRNMRKTSGHTDTKCG